MHALALARQRLRARLDSPSLRTPVRLARGLVKQGQPQYLPVLSSALAQDLLERGYDALTLERVYQNRAAGDLGMVGRVADRVVLDLPVHSALRERLQAFTGEICAAAVVAVRNGESEFRLLSSPCGLGQELLSAGERLRATRPETFARLRCWGVDPDPQGEILPEARRRARELGFRVGTEAPTGRAADGAPSIEFLREDLRRRRGVSALVRNHGPFHFICCPGLALSHSVAEVTELIGFYTGLLAPGGQIAVDRWQAAETTRLDRCLSVPITHMARSEFRRILEKAGLEPIREHMTGEGGCVVTLAQRPV